MAVKIEEYRGVEKLYCAEVSEMRLEDGTVRETWGTPFQLSGVQEISNELSESSETHYYDNVGAIVVDSEGNDTYTLTVSIPALRTRAIIEGTYYDETTHALIGTPKVRKYYAIGFIGNKLNGEDEYVWILKGKFSGGGETHTTKDDGTDATNIQYTFTSIHTETEFTLNGEKAKFLKVEANDVINTSKWFDAVVTPDTLASLEYQDIDAETLVVMPQEDTYLGKTGADLVSPDTHVLETGAVKGTLKFVEGFTEFNSTVPAEQEGFYFPFKLVKSGTKMTFKKNGVVSKDGIAWEEDNIFRIASPSDTFEVLVDGVSVVKFTFETTTFSM